MAERGTLEPDLSLRDIDFADRYRKGLQRANRPKRAPAYWDSRAPAMSAGAPLSSYAQAFIARMDLTGCETLLDVGCGPGTIGLAIAPRLAHVYGLDYSPGMLAAFSEQARARGLASVTPILRSWDDDWSDVPVCDVVVASRATAVPDFEAAALKLAGKARRRVYLSYPALGRFGGDDVCRLLGRPHKALPDYLCVVGILHHLGIHPRLDFLSDANRFANCAGFDQFLTKVRALMGDLDAGEVATLRTYFDTHRDRLGVEPMRWAFISWDVPASA